MDRVDAIPADTKHEAMVVFAAETDGISTVFVTDRISTEQIPNEVSAILQGSGHWVIRSLVQTTGVQRIRIKQAVECFDETRIPYKELRAMVNTRITRILGL